MRKGYSFIEAIVAIGIISSLVVVAISVVNSSSETENINKDFLTAGLLAVESNELVLSLYQTNVARFGKEYAQSCGLMYQTYSGEADDCNDSNEQIYLKANYIIQNDWDNYRIQANLNEVPLIENDVFDPSFRLKEKDIQGTSVYVYSDDANDTPTKFYRSVYISNDIDGESWKVESKVGWIRPGGIPTIETKSITINYNE